MPRKSRTTRPDPEQLDLGCLSDPASVAVSEVAEAAAVRRAARQARARWQDDSAAAWADSDFAWLRPLPPARKGRAAVALLALCLAELGVPVARPGENGDRFTWAGRRYRVRTSLLWAQGEYVFQHVTAAPCPEADLVLFGVSPDRVHAWVVPADEVPDLNTGARDWLKVTPHDPPGDLLACGDGTLVTAAQRILGTPPQG